MNSSWSSYRGKYPDKRRKRGMFLLCIVMIAALLWLTWKTFYPHVVAVANTDPSEKVSAEIIPMPGSDHISTQEIPESNLVCTWTITEGDTLCSIFENYEISQSVMYQILSADEELLALDVIKPGHLLTFTLDRETRELLSMELFVHLGKRVIYNRTEDGTFDYDEVTIPGEWKDELLNGNIIKLHTTKAGRIL